MKLREVVLAFDETTGRVTAVGDLEETRAADKASEILDYLRGGEGTLTQADINDAVSGSRNAISQALGQLVKLGLVALSGDGRRGSPFLYSVRN
ncbi:helix-turn-helix domain-containing protein [Candidatus Palauibacter sp.]|uniref:helix-turn-helix domain-containing protein n=1 Tax=Candidatus Palauibacter sp. TaxID=3101350 RepID=UPI003AF25995